ncbi:hypothetical protein [Planotetraspora phitsanulokensis]|uniref:Uncharacterized protein n=1 Tax=Planotetraspora phitsanulokensis TaxID=575192 RepID=A0A8J3UHA9_9ACTN|nr:hypothetical protein [Planotetraspora phitsanulokensis]GII42284.1 hypothetical protein Pph01_72870 [Planotetraspora phitsanulokensis]
MSDGLRVAVTGHRDLTPATTDLVGSAMRRELAEHAPAIVGVSCLAPGADQIFADLVLRLGGALEAIVPARDYGCRLPAPDREAFERLLGSARKVLHLPYDAPTPATYDEANTALLVDVDLLIAVWDGRPAQGQGGTAEVVSAALARSIEVRILWPEGAGRTGAP